MKKEYAYARVSTREQHLDRQITAFQQLGISDREIITDKASGKTLERPGYLMLRDHLLRDGDVLVIKSLDRLSRNKDHIKQELEHFKAHHIRVKVIDIPTTMIELPEGQEWVFEMINNILIEVLSSIAEQERLTTRKRQAEGIAVAKKQGRHLGRPKSSFPANWEQVYSDWQSGLLTAKKAWQTLGLRKTTFYQMAKEYKEQSEES